MRVYLAGKMRGRPHYNYPMFDQATDTLRAQGHEVVSPAALDVAFDSQPDYSTESTPLFLKHCLLRITVAFVSVDAIVLLPDHQDSLGVAMEIAMAHFLDIPVYHYEDLAYAQ